MILALAMRHSVERPAMSMEGGNSLWSGLPPPSVRPEKNERTIQASVRHTSKNDRLRHKIDGV